MTANHAQFISIIITYHNEVFLVSPSRSLFLVLVDWRRRGEEEREQQ